MNITAVKWVMFLKDSVAEHINNIQYLNNKPRQYYWAPSTLKMHYVAFALEGSCLPAIWFRSKSCYHMLPYLPLYKTLVNSWYASLYNTKQELKHA